MNVVLLHLTYLWGELLGLPGATVSDDEAARAGARAAERLPHLVAALTDGARGVLVLDAEGGFRRELEPAHTEAHRRWPAPAWRPLRGAVAACGLPVAEPPPYPAGALLPLGEEAASLAGKRGSARDVIATVAAWWHGADGQRRWGPLTIVSGRSTLAGLADVAAGIHLVRAIHPPTGDAGWSWSEGLKDHYGATAKPPLPSLDPRLVVDWKALVQCGTWHAQAMKWDRSALGEVTAHKLIAAHGGALAAVQMAAMVAAKDKLPGVTAPAMMALRWAAERGGAAALRALALWGCRDDVPLDVAGLLGGERPQEGGEHGDEEGKEAHRRGSQGHRGAHGGPPPGSGREPHGEADRGGAVVPREQPGEAVADDSQADRTEAQPQGQAAPGAAPPTRATGPRLAPSSAASDTGEGAAEGPTHTHRCAVPGPFKGPHCRAEMYGLPFQSDEWCDCRCHAVERCPVRRPEAPHQLCALAEGHDGQHSNGIDGPFAMRWETPREGLAAIIAEGRKLFADEPRACPCCGERSGHVPGCELEPKRPAIVRRDPKPENPKPEEKKSMNDQNRTAIVRPAPASAAMTTPGDFGAEHMRIVREAFAPTASQAEFEVMWAGAKARGLDPVKKQIFFIKRFDQMRGEDVWASQVSIDGFRSIAASSALYDGQDEPEYEYDDQGRVLLARVRVYRKGVARPFVGVARWNEYVQTKKNGDPTHMWRKMEHTMLSKCAEALGLRKAFPELLSGLHTAEEMSQAENEADPIPRPEPKAPPQLPPSVLTAKALLDRVPRAEDSAAIFEIVKQARAWPKVRGHAWLRLLALSSDAAEVEQTRALFGSDDLPPEVLAKLEEAAAARLSAIEAEQTSGAAA